MDKKLAIAQTLKYAEELREVYTQERTQRRAAEEALEQLRASYATTVRALAAALELRDDQTGDHADRVARLALRLAELVAPELAADPELEYGFLLHDLGKIGVADAILLKPGPLDPGELTIMRGHPLLGEQIVARVPYLGGLARTVIASHHERWDRLSAAPGRNGHPPGRQNLRRRRRVRRDDERPALSRGAAFRGRSRRDRARRGDAVRSRCREGIRLAGRRAEARGMSPPEISVLLVEDDSMVRDFHEAARDAAHDRGLL